jgi:predicted acylesterase/phospholipase RssA
MTETASTAPPLEPPDEQCDVIMKGGITSGVVYPSALVEFANHYRLRGLGGASAGAIGAVLGAAAEYGRRKGGFEVLRRIPDELGDGALAKLFQPSPSTRGLLPIMLRATGHDRPGAGSTGVRRVGAVVAAAAKNYPLASLLGLIPGAAVIAAGILAPGWTRIPMLVAGVPLAIVGWASAMAIRLTSVLTRDVPANKFGICTGIGADPKKNPGFTDWLAAKIDEAAGLPPGDGPLTFGQLRGGPKDLAGDSPRAPSSHDHERRDVDGDRVDDEIGEDAADATLGDPADFYIDLRMITTCLTEGKPYELPLNSYRFFYQPDVWKTLFPGYVMDALAKAPPARPQKRTRWPEYEAEDEAAERQGYRRFPSAADLPVIVATRLSLSFPLLISAIPLATIDDSQRPKITFQPQWFTDGGFCSNFPVHLFDAPLPSRPTFALNLGTMSKGWQAGPDQTKNIHYAHTNSEGLSLPAKKLPEDGVGAVAGFAVSALNTSRNWSDNANLRYPGHRDRTVVVLQSTDEGGLNLFMDRKTITGLAERGQVAAAALVDQFRQKHYPENDPAFTGWDNHRWLRYRALISALPTFLQRYTNGRAALNLGEGDVPSYPLTRAGRKLAEELFGKFDEAADLLYPDDPEQEKRRKPRIAEFKKEPNPVAAVRRVPEL